MNSPNITLPPIPDNISVIAGPLLIGININWGLMGMIVVQVYIYQYSFPKDPKIVKGLVFGLGTLEFVQTILATVDGFRWFASGFGNMNSLNNLYFNPFDSPFLDGVISLIVQLFFAYRIWVLTKSYTLTGSVIMVSMIGAAGGMAVGIQGHIGGKVSEITGSKHIVAAIIWLVGSALSDTIIAVIMVTVLLRSRNGISETNRTISRLVRMIIETNSLTAGFAIIFLILFMAFLDTASITVPLSFMLGKLYTNTLLAVLNNRLFLTTSRRGGLVIEKFSSTFVQSDPPIPASSNPSTLAASENIRQRFNIDIVNNQVKSTRSDPEIPLHDMDHKKSQTMFDK